MKPSTQKAMSTMHHTQITWAKALALTQLLRDKARHLEKTKAPDAEWTEAATQHQEARNLLREATAALLAFGLDYAKLAAAKHGQKITPEIEKLYQDDIINYCHTDTLPEWWQSKLIDLTMRLKPSDVGL